MVGLPITDRATKLFLLAHQDDEIAFAPLLARLKADGQPVRVVYLTDGGAGRASPELRCTESRRALASLGILPSEVVFLGAAMAVPDGALFRRLPQVYAALESVCRGSDAPGEIYTLGWEGGHVDHDAAHVIAMALAVARDRVHQAWQVPFYRAIDRGPPWFTLFAPLTANGPVARLSLTRRESWLRAALVRFFPSQWRSLTALGPLVLWRALTDPTLKLQPMVPGRLWERPTPGRLLYEKLYAVSFAEVSACIGAFLGELGITEANPP
ncbi:GlcNAc-PI de-N-acetylase family [Rubellimicrobium mesophilum DSM 19309]|uniref:GlcNAc-PI de-N-acetylase family n=1 Tax=Rubellimicrobium mesophilum DSM 19309 TaxID=442562 RepID=A0A017HW53_9RHOB|nr:PIG-L family deacetylase [Rubellimicrobium mesophilum]EYD78403.1 GlcNAc-PI de-N-acetylase family [Rubellimicrobium mesophilum DSM 19309]